MAITAENKKLNPQNQKSINKNSKTYKYYDELIHKLAKKEISKDDLIQTSINKDNHLFNLKKIIYYLEAYQGKFTIPCEKTVNENLTVLYSFKVLNQSFNVSIPLNYFATHDIIRIGLSNSTKNWLEPKENSSNKEDELDESVLVDDENY